MKTIIAILLFAGSLAAQSHSVSLTWVDTTNPVGTTYSVYRAPGLCSATPSFAPIISALATKTYLDTTVTTGNYCYAVTAVLAGIESVKSATVLAAVPPSPPTGLTVVVQ